MQQGLLDFSRSFADSGASRDGLLHQLFERQAQAHGDHPAVICGGVRLTYAQLERRANQLARLLRARGVGRGDCVGLLLPRSAQVYATLLGILKAGAAYVPLDPEYPADRVQFILSDCKARALVTAGLLAPKAAGFEGALVTLDAAGPELDSQSPEPLTAEEVGLAPTDLCYIIYTSGTTGRPKGVQIEHRSAHHLVQAEGQLFQVQPEDRVYQGFSIAFDASVEEVWLAFRAGAALVAGTAEMVRAGAALAPLLSDSGVTVLSCVPTLLSMMEQDIPTVRLLILGGEVCPPDLVRRWWKPGRRLYNTYGPTEATVIATCAECHPDQPVTIGKPLPNYSAWILDEASKLVADGQAGELCLGGIGLARGYVNRPELTKQKFVLLTPDGVQPRRLYRTGDLARWTAAGEIEFLGRIDTQVKIRGFRVELSEIESALTESVEIKAAAVALREDQPGLQQLVAYLVPRQGTAPDEAVLKNRLRSRLPAYMVPALFISLPELPTLASGKVDRKRLPAPALAPAAPKRAAPQPANEVERGLLESWQRLFSPAPVSLQDDFFLDLGGHSLLAARLVSELRRCAPFERISMADVYRHTTIAALAKEFGPTSQSMAVPPGTAGSRDFESSKEADVADSGQTAAKPQAIPFWRHFWCGAAQCAVLGLVLSFCALQWLTPYLTYTILVEEEYSFLQAVLGAFASLIVFYPIMLMVPILAKWLIIGRYQPGVYPLWGTYYFRWWLVSKIESAVPVNYLSGTPLLNVYCRLMGARIGPDVQLQSNAFAIYDLLSIGEGSSINVDTNLPGYTVEDGWLKIGSISIGKRCYVGARATVCHDSVMEDDAALEDLSLLPQGGTIRAGKTWLGSPPSEVREESSLPSAARRTSRQAASSISKSRRALFGVLHAIGVLIFPVLVVAALFPGIVEMNRLNYIDPYYWYLLLAPLVGVSFVLLLALEIAAVKWLVLGKVAPGRFSIHSGYYLRKWFVDQTMDLSLDVLGPLYASLYLAPWYRLLGAKLGNGAEVSTASFISPDLLSIGDESFVADSVCLGAPRVRDGHMSIDRNQIGQRSFIGNSAMLPPGTVIGNSVLIGCLSAPPADPAQAVREDSAWLGSPALYLPQRQKSTQFSAESTYKPTRKLRALRAAIEFVRVITPSTCFIILLSLLFSSLLLLHDHYSLTQTLLFFPPLYVACGVAAALFAMSAKWLLVWRYRPGEKPLWSTFVWRNELLNALHEHLAGPFLIDTLTGTPFICWYFRLLGAHIGRRVYMETTDISEFDLAHIGDEAALNADCTVQTHLFEDRVMKMSTVQIGPRCNVGAGSLVLYDTRMEEGSTLGNLSLLMKGEVLPAASRWMGVPATAADGRGA